MMSHEEDVTKLKDSTRKINKSVWTTVALAVESNDWWRARLEAYLEVMPALAVQQPKIEAHLQTLTTCTEFSAATLGTLASMFEELHSLMGTLPQHAEKLKKELLQKTVFMANVAVGQGANVSPGDVEQMGAVLAAAQLHDPMGHEISELQTTIGKLIEESTMQASSSKLVEKIDVMLGVFANSDATPLDKKQSLDEMHAAKGDIHFTRVPDKHVPAISKAWATVLHECCTALMEHSCLTDGFLDSLLAGGEWLTDLVEGCSRAAVPFLRSMAVLTVLRLQGPLAKDLQKPGSGSHYFKLLEAKMEDLQKIRRAVVQFVELKEKLEKEGFPDVCSDAMATVTKAVQTDTVELVDSFVKDAEAQTKLHAQVTLKELAVVAGGTQSSRVWYDTGGAKAETMAELTTLALREDGLFSVDPDKLEAKILETQKALCSRVSRGAS